MVDEQTFADALFVARVETGSTLDELADLAGVDVAVLTAAERGEVVPVAGVVLSLAGVLGLDALRMLDLAFGV